jgi:predicted nucleotide-binding protein
VIGAVNGEPRLTAFVGSSSESRGIAEAILENLEGKVEITCWYHDFYKPTSSVFDDLLEQIGGFDFGIFIFAPDDVVEIRQHSAGSVRDNVLFELGLFLGILGKERVFIVAHPDFHTMRVPTDLHGRNVVPFLKREDGNLVAALGTDVLQIGFVSLLRTAYYSWNPRRYWLPRKTGTRETVSDRLFATHPLSELPRRSAFRLVSAAPASGGPINT